MKLKTLLLNLVLALTPAFGESADALYQTGLTAMKAGDVSQARRCFTETLRLQPDHAYARYQLGRLKGAEDTIAAKQRAAQLAAVQVNVHFDEVEFRDALLALSHMVEKATTKNSDDGGTPFSPNFMIQDPSDRLPHALVTVNLKQVPADKALDFMLQQVRGFVRYDKHAIIIRPTSGSRQPTRE